MPARAVVALTAVWSVIGAPVCAQSPRDDTLRARALATRSPVPPVVDGRVDDSAWISAPPVTDFVQHEPYEGAPSTERTVVRVVYDAEALYVGAWLYDSDPAGIVQGENRRDAPLTETDAFLIVLDTYHDRQNAFVFGTTPAGIEYDGQVTREGTGDFAARRRQDRSVVELDPRPHGQH